MPNIRTEKLSQQQYRIYMDKAEEFYKLMKHAQSEKLWTGAGLNGIHCAISACDALTTFYLGRRAVGQKHEDVAILLKQIPIKGVSQHIQQLLSILSVKNLVEYEAREFHQEDATKVLTQAERLYLWIREHLK